MGDVDHLPIDYEDLLVRADSHIAAISRDPQAWWDDEHCLDNGQSAVVVRRLADAVRVLRVRLRQANEAFDECTGDYPKELVANELWRRDNF